MRNHYSHNHPACVLRRNLLTAERGTGQQPDGLFVFQKFTPRDALGSIRNHPELLRAHETGNPGRTTRALGWLTCAYTMQPLLTDPDKPTAELFVQPNGAIIIPHGNEEGGLVPAEASARRIIERHGNPRIVQVGQILRPGQPEYDEFPHLQALADESGLIARTASVTSGIHPSQGNL